MNPINPEPSGESNSHRNVYEIVTEQIIRQLVCLRCLCRDVGVSSVLIRGVSDETSILIYFVITAVAMLVVLVHIARRFGKPE